ncbi:cadherin-like domain-containing protein, partial [Sphingomonas sp.]|uniref:cadherin-like domain-containing protein n=1 Tax=Sphingomonas sp. TaxID=28214 RepID=UPI002D138EA9
MAADISADRATSLSVDVDNDGVADPGDTVHVTLTIANIGTSAAINVLVNDALNGMTLVAGSIQITPIAADDAFSMTGNTPITLTAAQLLGNDLDPDGDPAALTITAVSGASHGTVVLNGDGSVTFTPDTGYTGAASFTYTVEDAQGLSSVVDADVALTVTAPTWYVDSAYSGANGASDGSFLRPFTGLTELNGGNGDGSTNDDVDGAGDTIFVYDRGVTYGGGITLETGQKLYGDGQAYTVNGMSIGAGTGNAVIGHTGAGIILAVGNTIAGIDLVGTATGAVGIVDGGGTVGTLTIGNVGIGGQGQAIDIDQGGTLAVSLNSVASTGSTGNSGGVIQLSGVTGSFAVGGTVSITGSHAQTGIDIANGTGTLTATFSGT